MKGQIRKWLGMVSLMVGILAIVMMVLSYPDGFGQEAGMADRGWAYWVFTVTLVFWFMMTIVVKVNMWQGVKKPAPSMAAIFLFAVAFGLAWFVPMVQSESVAVKVPEQFWWTNFWTAVWFFGWPAVDLVDLILVRLQLY